MFKPLSTTTTDVCATYVHNKSDTAVMKIKKKVYNMTIETEASPASQTASCALSSDISSRTSKRKQEVESTCTFHVHRPAAYKFPHTYTFGATRINR